MVVWYAMVTHECSFILKPLVVMHMTLICILKHLQIQLKQVANIEYTFTTDFCLQYCVGLCGHLAVSLILQVQPSVCL